MRTDRFVKYAPKAARFLLTALADNLPGARRLLVSAPLAANDGGDGGDFTLSVAGASTSARGVVKLAGQLSGTADSPSVTGLRVTDGGSDVALSNGVVADGDALVRSGTSLVGQPVLARAGGTMTGALNMGGQALTGLPSGAASGDAATYGQLTAMLNGLDWQRSVASASVSDPTTLSPSVGDRWLLLAGGLSGSWTGHADEIAEKSAAGWTFIAPNDGYTVHVDDEGVDYTYNGTAWVSLGASIDHGALLNLDDDAAHPQYQLASELGEPDGYASLDASGLLQEAARRVSAGSDPSSPVPGELWVNATELKFRDNQGTPTTQFAERQSNRDQNGGYAALDSNGHVLRPIRVIRAATDPSTPAVGEVWINGGLLKFRDNQGSPTTQTVESLANRDQNGGYPSLDGSGIVSRPVRLVRTGSDPGSPSTGEVWVNGPDLKFRDNQGTPATQLVERQGNKGVNGGYAALDGSGKVVQPPATHASTHASAGSDAISPASIGAVATTRTVSTSGGLTGGGDLSANRTVSIAAYTGLLAKDIDPGSASWSANEVKVHATYDIGADGHIQPTAIRLPPTVNASLVNDVVFEFDDASTVVTSNSSTSANADFDANNLSAVLMSNVSSAASNNGRAVRKVIFRTRNTTGSTVSGVDIAAFRLRAFAMPRGGGSAL